MTTPRKLPLVLLAFFIIVILTIKSLGMLINVTPSMKEGIYIRASGEIKRGDIVAACLPDPYKTIGLEKFYIEKGRKCDGADPVIKKVIAVPGDDVILAGDYISVNHHRILLKTKNQDGMGRMLSIYPRGTYSHTKGYWLVGTNSPNSWDSRYWGAIPKTQILYKLKPVWVLT